MSPTTPCHPLKSKFKLLPSSKTSPEVDVAPNSFEKKSHLENLKEWGRSRLRLIKNSEPAVRLRGGTQGGRRKLDKEELCVHSSSGNWSQSSESGHSTATSHVPRSSISSGSVCPKHKRPPMTSASSSVTSESTTLTPDDGETCSMYSCDTEGYYTSFHLDSGLKTLREEEPPAPAHTSSALSVNSSHNNSTLTAESEYELFGRGSTSTTASSAGTVCTTLLIPPAPSVPERVCSQLSSGNKTLPERTQKISMDTRETQSLKLNKKPDLKMLSFEEVKQINNETNQSNLTRSNVTKHDVTEAKNCVITVDVHHDEDDDDDNSRQLPEKCGDSPDSGHNTCSSPVDSIASPSSPHDLELLSECSDLEGVERVERIREKTTMSASRIPSMCVITPPHSDDEYVTIAEVKGTIVPASALHQSPVRKFNNFSYSPQEFVCLTELPKTVSAVQELVSDSLRQDHSNPRPARLMCLHRVMLRMEWSGSSNGLAQVSQMYPLKISDTAPIINFCLGHLLRVMYLYCIFLLCAEGSSSSIKEDFDQDGRTSYGKHSSQESYGTPDRSGQLTWPRSTSTPTKSNSASSPMDFSMVPSPIQSPSVSSPKTARSAMDLYAVIHESKKRIQNLQKPKAGPIWPKAIPAKSVIAPAAPISPALDSSFIKGIPQPMPPLNNINQLKYVKTSGYNSLPRLQVQKLDESPKNLAARKVYPRRELIPSSPALARPPERTSLASDRLGPTQPTSRNDFKRLLLQKGWGGAPPAKESAMERLKELLRFWRQGEVVVASKREVTQERPDLIRVAQCVYKHLLDVSHNGHFLRSVQRASGFNEESCHSFAGGSVYPQTSPRIVDHKLQYTKAVISKPAPEWEGTAVINGALTELKLSDFLGKYLVFFFYPLDFTFVCPTEILAFNDRIDEFKALNTEVVGCSVDSHFTHLAWMNTPRKDGGLGNLRIPLLSDLTHKISKDYGVYLDDAGHTLRGLFIIDQKGVLRQITMNDLPVGRSVDETLRLVQAFQYTDNHGEVCPAGWKPGQDTIIPDPIKKKEFFKKQNANAKKSNIKDEH
ncbi:unnamed protein product [Nesidiocoris tenuis]|uniref:thioredoxin-dependent peroxiredoxin n=1 Tax=Nesidiocoris tenuis TaxID=355587 RepID=A0A6H5H104_9HEMI|nr:unnamed protein product [Nesidiocoris tenuis]